VKHWLIQLYPRDWQERYGDEFLAALEQRPLSGWDVLDILWCACEEHYAARVCEKGTVSMIDRASYRIVLMLVIGSLLVVRSILRADVLVFGVDLVAMVGVSLLVFGWFLAIRRRQQRVASDVDGNVL
jgi:hypothetical protein